MSFKVQMQMMGIFGLMPHQMGTLEPSWGRKEGRGREGEREGGREREREEEEELCTVHSV
jgi:hypothetical protein